MRSQAEAELAIANVDGKVYLDNQRRPLQVHMASAREDGTKERLSALRKAANPGRAR